MNKKNRTTGGRSTFWLTAWHLPCVYAKLTFKGEGKWQACQAWGTPRVTKAFTVLWLKWLIFMVSEVDETKPFCQLDPNFSCQLGPIKLPPPLYFCLMESFPHHDEVMMDVHTWREHSALRDKPFLSTLKHST